MATAIHKEHKKDYLTLIGKTASQSFQGRETPQGKLHTYIQNTADYKLVHI